MYKTVLNKSQKSIIVVKVSGSAPHDKIAMKVN